jgi:hypothetical protein
MKTTLDLRTIDGAVNALRGLTRLRQAHRTPARLVPELDDLSGRWTVVMLDADGVVLAILHPELAAQTIGITLERLAALLGIKLTDRNG